MTLRDTSCPSIGSSRGWDDPVRTGTIIKTNINIVLTSRDKSRHVPSKVFICDTEVIDATRALHTHINVVFMLF